MPVVKATSPEEEGLLPHGAGSSKLTGRALTRSSSGRRRALACYWASAIAGVIGLVAVLTTLVRYTSWSNTRVFGWWSEIHFAVILLFGALLLGVVLGAWRGRSSAVSLSMPSLVIRCCGGGAALAWGTSLLMDSLEDIGAGGRVLDLVLFGGLALGAMLLEWLSMALFFVAVAFAAVRATLGGVDPTSGAYRRRVSAVLMFVSVGAVLVLLEGAVRMANLLRPVTQGFPSKPSLLWQRRFVRLNSLGYRDREHSLSLPAGTKRILLIGDSYAFGAGIDDVEERLGDRLEAGLNRLRGEARYAVINAGKPDTHTQHHIEVLQRTLAFRPAYVFLIYVFNDIEHVTRPHRSVITDLRGPLSRLHPLRLVVLNSHFGEQVFLRVRQYLYRWGWSESGRTDSDPYEDETTMEAHLQAVERFFALCREAAAEARLIPFDTSVQASPMLAARYDRFVKRATERGIPVWSLANAFRGRSYQELRVNVLDGHPNGLANALAAEVVLERFRAEFLTGNPGASGRASAMARVDAKGDSR